MKFSLSTLLALLAITGLASPSLAQDDSGSKPFYRVEAIVFTHAGGNPDAWPESRPADHAGALDPAWRSFAQEQQRRLAESEGGSRRSDLQATLNVLETIASIESGEESLTEALLYPEPWLALDKLSEPMAQAKARLERSGAYRLRAWLAWHQALGESAGSRNVRIRDDHLLAIDWIAVAPTGRLLRDGIPVTRATELSPAFHYRLDGSIRLRRRQFMHADVVLDWRVRESPGISPWPVMPGEGKFERHRLDQSRTIRPGRLEYFDSEWLGLLLRVTPYEFESAEREPTDSDAEPETP